MSERLPRTFYQRDAREVARDLLGRILVTSIGGERTSGIITEVEAYLGAHDAASHTYRGLTQRNRAMYLAGGHAYIYFIYGMYYCFNVVTGIEGDGEAVLVRGVEPLEGVEMMRERRGLRAMPAKELANGPGKLAIALGIGPELNGTDLLADPRIWIEPGERLSDANVVTTPRIGITKSTEHHWRWVRREEDTTKRKR
ncbi:MAG TPA: DNA-3-methyladenine glycosylase [Candidatus Kapabacteria bacterium]|nr:DNA-3-methyladenine glycosylase [Candidatus Kapabacteria bacterium]